MASAGIFQFGPQGRFIQVDASGRLLTTTEPDGLFVYSFGPEGRALTVDSSGRLVISNQGVGVGSGEQNTASNVGAGEGVFKQKVGADLEFKSLIGGSGISLTAATNTIIIDAEANADISQLRTDFDNASGIWVKDAANIGLGEGIYDSKSNAVLQLKSLWPGSGIRVEASGNSVVFHNTLVDDLATIDNVGIGSGEIFAQRNTALDPNVLELRRLLAGSGMVITTSGNTIRVDSALEDDVSINKTNIDNLQTDFTNSSGVFVKNAENIGGAQGEIFSAKDPDQNLELRTILAGSGIKVETSGNVIRVDAHVINGESLGLGSGIFVQKDHEGNLELRSLLAGTNIGINQTANSLEIFSTAADGVRTDFDNSSGIFYKKTEAIIPLHDSVHDIGSPSFRHAHLYAASGNFASGICIASGSSFCVDGKRFITSHHIVPDGGLNNIYVGQGAGESQVRGSGTSSNNIFIGKDAGKLITGANNVCVGVDAGLNAAAGEENVLIGGNAGKELDSGAFNVIIGFTAGEVQTGDSNVIIGSSACKEGTLGNGNVYIGPGAGLEEDGSNNIFIGKNAGGQGTTNSNQLSVGISSSSPLIFGKTSTPKRLTINGKVKIDTGFHVDSNNTVPSGMLEVKGDIHTPVHGDINIDNLTTVDLSNSNVLRLAFPDSSGGQIQFTNQSDGGKYTLIIKQNNGGSGIIDGWPTTFKWKGGTAPTLTATSGAVDVVSFVYDAPEDTYYGDFGSNFS